MSHDLTAILNHFEKKSWVFDPKVDGDKIQRNLQGLKVDELIKLMEEVKPRSGAATVIQLYQSWINLNSGRSPHLFVAWFNLGTELSAAGDQGNALTSYRNALAIKPDFYQAAVNLGLMQENHGQTEEALATWKQVLQPNEARTTLLNHRGRLMENLGRYDEAEDELYNSLLTDPNQPDAIQHWTHLRQKQCKWPALGFGIPGLTREDISLSAGPLSGLAFVDDVVLQRRIVEEWLKRKMPSLGVSLAPANGYNHSKIRVGYLSSDYCRHPITYLITELFEKHDRSQFEVYGYCATKDDGSDVRKRILSAFDKLALVSEMSEEALAKKIREDEIDILVDLNGMTKGTRLGALRYRPAPIQMTYLGYIGPIPFEELDYMICDHFTVPDNIAHEYQPKPLFMPDCYQVNDGKLGIGSPKTRTELGLPDDKFVLCSFSNSYKVTEEIFDSWMEILNKTPNTVLWLLDDNPHARKNTLEWATSKGIASDRIIYAGRVSPEDYLSRMRNADLFLDTYPYNSGTTASDALRMGLPLLTLSGECFASRMAGSLLTAVGLPELIATDLQTYVSKAIALINDPVQYRTLRTRLEDGAWARGLGDTSRFTKQLETEYLKVVKKP